MNQKDHIAKAAALRAAERAKTHNLLDVLGEAHSFINRHTENWYYSGNELLGRIESVIDAEWNAEYQDYLKKAEGLPIRKLTLDEYKIKARELACAQIIQAAEATKGA